MSPNSVSTLPSYENLILRNAQIIIFVTLFTNYCFIHAARKALSNSKPILEEYYSEATPWSVDLMGSLDTVFMLSYSIGMFVTGYFGDRLHPVKFLSTALLTTAVCTCSFGAVAVNGDRINTTFFYFLVYFLWIVNGFSQSAVWPVLIRLMGHWFTKHGFIFGLFSVSASTGNIIGSGISAALISSLGSKDSVFAMFLVPSGCLILIIVLNFLLVWPSPRETSVFGLDPLGVHPKRQSSLTEECCDTNCSTTTFAVVTSDDFEGGEKSERSFLKAFLIKGVIIYSVAFACIKGVDYTMFFWLPKFLSSGGLSDTQSVTVSMWYDVGQIMGGPICGLISDTIFKGKRGPTCELFILLAVVPIIMLAVSTGFDIVYLSVVTAFTGFLVGGAVLLVSGTVCADLGKLPAIDGDQMALSQVSGIIDGSGSLGAGIVQLVVTKLQGGDENGWTIAFIFLSSLLGASFILLLKVAVTEIRELYGKGNQLRTN